jgi:hypothetical protein
MSDHSNPPPPTTGELRKELGDQLSRAATLRGNQDQVAWRAFTAFWGSNSLLLVALSQKGELTEKPGLVAAVALAGTFLSLSWWQILRRTLGHLSRYEMVIETLERKLGLPNEVAFSDAINVEDTHRFMPGGPRGRPIMLFCCLLAGCIWFASFVWVISLRF